MRPARARFAALILALALVMALSGPAFAKKPPPPPPPPSGPSALVLYDTTGEFGWIGELYAMATANLAGHFGSVTTKPVVSYAAGDIAKYDATFYLGSTYDEPLPPVFLDEVLASTKPVVWAYSNIWQLVNRASDFQSRYGFSPWYYDTSSIGTVVYKGQSLNRYRPNGSGIMTYSALDPVKATVLASAVRDDGTTIPWAVRSGSLTYVGEIPFSYTSESDRTLVFSDLMFDAMAPATVERHRALVRLEDINPDCDPAMLREFADYLYGRGIPFAFGVSPVFTDPLGVSTGAATTITLKQRRDLADAINYMISKGGVLVGHGYTHQYSNIANPYNGMTGDDYEFYRVTENLDHSLTYQGPLPEDSYAWAAGRMDSANNEFKAAKVTAPSIFEFPHYASSANGYKAAADKFAVRYDRGLYYSGLLSGGPVDPPQPKGKGQAKKGDPTGGLNNVNHARMIGQFFPYVVKDVYGSKVLPENLGNPAEAWFNYPERTGAQIVADAKRNLVIRDGFASFFYHPFLGTAGLGQIIDGIQALGYQFVSPASL
jgi:uncharacterized protein YdaL